MYHVLLLYSKRIPSVILCAQVQLRYLASKNLISLEENSVFHVTQKQFCNSQMVIIVRGSTKSELVLVQKMKKKGKKIVYVLDDDLLNVPFYSKSYYYFLDKEIRNNFIALLTNSDILVSPSIRIIEKYGSGKKSVLIREAIESVYQKKEKKKEKIKIGFAGSKDREYEFDNLLSEVLREIRNKYGNKIEIECIGIAPQRCIQYIDRIFSYQNSYEDYLNLIEKLEWDIGLAPLISNEFNECKYYNKYLEYGRYGIIGVYSNVYPYSEKIENWSNGILVDNRSELWISILEQLIQKELETSTNSMIRNNIYNDINQNYIVDYCAENYYEKIVKFCKNNQQVNINKLEFFILKSQLYFLKFFCGLMRKFRKMMLSK